MIRVDGHTRRMRHFEALPGVARVVRNPGIRAYPEIIPLIYTYGQGREVPTGIAPNLEAIGAPEVWALGVTGEGIVVGVIDSGFDWGHPALYRRYRGWGEEQVDHDYNWHDAWGHRPYPYDVGSHGTHVLGIIVGDDDSLRTGVAPGAAWMGCRATKRRGMGNPAGYVECLEFMLAPYRHGGDPFRDGDVTRAPHLLNHSWSCGRTEGCDDALLEPAFEALYAAGILSVASAGNQGPACGTVAGHRPAAYASVVAVGATDRGGAVTPFSSRGPAGERIKPDLVAPGEEIVSAVAGEGHGWDSGTSMAAPHVTGLVALLWSAEPALIGDLPATRDLLHRTAVSVPVERGCGDATGAPNNVSGWGLIDAAAAVQEALKSENWLY
jgi:subtilisin family serine protease